MYHFTADHSPEAVRLSFRALIPGHIRQYLKDFQLDAIRFMHNFLAKGEFCVYNDESGLGKQTSVAVLLDAACSNKKCLIVVQNDDRYVNGWEFHFNVLTNTSVAVIKDEKDSTDTPHHVYLAKWSTLRTIGDLSKFKFDFIILDNRGQMLNNSFCTSMLLKHYERKINILISSVDVTSDLKLLHNVLRLGGRLEPQYSSFKIFEEKFKLPDAKELAYKRVDLEEYFCKRERLADYCKTFRLRRYCHQFESQLPLVKEDRYKINLELWREKQNSTNSESSSIEYVNNKSREDEHIKDTQELFEEYCRQKRKEHLQFQQEEEQRLQQREREMLKSIQTQNDVIYNVDDEVALINDTPPNVSEKTSADRDNSDEPVLMSPLMVESDSDADDVPEICHDPMNDIEIVDLSSEERENQQQIEQNSESIDKSKKVKGNTNDSRHNNNKVSQKKERKLRRELSRLEEDIVDTLKITETSKRLTRHAKDDDTIKRLKDRLEEKRLEITTNSKRTNTNEITPKNTKSNIKLQKSTHVQTPDKGTIATAKNNALQKTPKHNQKKATNAKEIKTKENCSTSKNTTPKNNEKSNLTNSNKNLKSNTAKNKQTDNNSNTVIPVTLRESRTVKKSINKTSTKQNNNQVDIKMEIIEETPITQTNKSSTKESQAKHVNSEKIRLKREIDITPVGVHLKQTRSMQRLTRSAGGSKYQSKNLALQIDKINKNKKRQTDKENPKIKRINNTNKKAACEQTKKATDKNTQMSIISHGSSQDYESIQCAQRLSGAAAFDNGGNEKTSKFLIPPTPPNIVTRNSLLPSSLTSSAGFFTESDVIFIPPSNPLTGSKGNRKRDYVISLSSSDNENSTSQSSSINVSTTSRRTRALKPKRNQQQQQQQKQNSVRDTTSKVSNFSELLSQQNNRASGKSPDLFSNCSDLIQLPCTQPNLDSEEPNTPFEGFKIFGSEVKQLQQHYAFANNNKTNLHVQNAKKSYRDQRSCLDILEKMFEPSNKKQKTINKEKVAATNPTKKSTRATNVANKQKPQAPILPSHPIEAITEARQQQALQNKRRRCMTAPSSGLNEDEIFEITNNGTFGSVMRLHSNGDISPVQNTQKANAKQHNKITNYLIGNLAQNAISGSQEDLAANSGNGAVNNTTMEAGTPSKRHQQLVNVQNSNVKKSPKSRCNSTQATKLTKWFTKPSELLSHQGANKTKSSNSKKTSSSSPSKHLRVCEEIDLTSQPQTTSPTQTTGKRVIKRRRLDLSFKK